jgi:ABC-type multidrug transport system fused ATPase/permease subunit
MNLFSLIKRYKKGIVIAILLVIIENVAWIIEPTVFGKVIDALISKASEEGPDSFLNPLILWIGVFVVNSGTGTLRRSVEPKIFLTMFTEIATSISRIGKEQGLSVSMTAARSELSREYITFFQYRLPEIIEQSISIGGAIIALFFFDVRIALTCLLIILPLLVLTSIYNKKVGAIQKNLHDTREEAFNIFSSGDPERVHAYYTAMTSGEKTIANWGAMNFGILRFFLLGIFLMVLYISIDLDGFSTGSIYSIIAYLWTFVSSSEYLPELMESWTSLKDISRRLQQEG